MPTPGCSPTISTRRSRCSTNPAVVAVAGCVQTARGRALGLTGNMLVGHRQRIYAIGQRVLKFGQT